MMGEDGVLQKLCNMKALLGIVAGAGASYGLYKMLLRSCKEDPERKKIKARESGTIQPGSLMAKVSGFNVVSGKLSTEVASSKPECVPINKQISDLKNRFPTLVLENLLSFNVCSPEPGLGTCEILSKSPSSLEPRHLSMLLSLLQSSPNPTERKQALITLGNAAAFTVNQDLLREFGGLHVIASFLSDPDPDVRVQTLNALNNLSMNICNQEHLKIYVPSVLELIEMSPVNSDLQLAALRLLTNLTVTDKHQHLLKRSITLLLSLLVVSNSLLQIQVLKVLVNLSSNPDMIDDIVQAQAPASLVLLFDCCTSTEVLLRLLVFIGNLRAWRPSEQVAEDLRRRLNSLYCVLLDSCSQIHSRLPQLLSHTDGEVRAQVMQLLA